MPPKTVIPSLDKELANTTHGSEERLALLQAEIKQNGVARILKLIEKDILDLNEKFKNSGRLSSILKDSCPLDEDHYITLLKLALEKKREVTWESIAFGIIGLKDQYGKSTLLEAIASEHIDSVSRVDDSSDDEYVPPNFSSEKFYKDWKEIFKENETFDCTKSIFSFISHQLGVAIIRSNPVHEHYWRELKKISSSSNSFRNYYEEIKKTVKENIVKCLHKVFSVNPSVGYDDEIDSCIDSISCYFLTRQYLMANTIGKKKTNESLLSELPIIGRLLWILYLKLDRFLTEKKNKVLNGKRDSFIENIFTSVKDISPATFMRKTLKPSMRLVFNNQVEFLGSLFLALRSSKRRGRHLMRHGDGNLDDFKPVIYSFKGNYDVCELQMLCKGEARSRKDEILHFGSYRDIVKRIHFFGGDKNVKNLVKLLRAILTFSHPLPNAFKVARHLEEEFMEFVHELALLIGGCEGVRNPAAFIHTMMMLDLLEQGVYKTWQECLVDKMPMAITSDSNNTVVSAARYLHQEYSKETDYHYQYPGKPLSNKNGTLTNTQKAKINELIAREDSLTQDWLKWKLKVDNLGDTENKIKEYITCIIDECKTWFPGIVVVPTQKLQSVLFKSVLPSLPPIKKEENNQLAH